MIDPVTSSIGSICRIFMWLLQLEAVHALELGGESFLLIPHPCWKITSQRVSGLKNQVNINIPSALPVASGWQDHRAYKVGIANYLKVPDI